MKLSLFVTIAIKDFIPKNKSIPYENYVCLFSLNNYNATINLSNLINQNIKHKIDSFNSNIIYNLHMFDSNNNSLIGIYQLIINFDKIKHLNKNDTLTQEETAKIIIDQKAKRQIFDKITNMGDIYLILSIEIKIIDKEIITSGNKQDLKLTKKILNIENIDNNSECNNLTPKTLKRKQIIRTMKNDREPINRLDTFTGYNEVSITEYFKDEDDPQFSQGNTIKKYKSLNKAKIMRQNNDWYNGLYDNPYFNNSCTVIMSPKYRNTHCNLKKDGKIKTNRKKKPVPQKKVTILNLMEQKLGPSFYKSKEDNLLELSNQSKDFKNTSISFTKYKFNNNMNKRNSFSSFNNYVCNFNEVNKQNSIKKKNIRHFDESDYFQRKTYQNKNKILVNLSGKSNIERIASERKGKIKKNKRTLSLINSERMNIENSNNDNISNNNTNINNILLKTESEIKILSERKKNIKKHLRTNTELKQIIKEKNSLIKENFNNNYYMEKSRGTFSPKLSLKIKFNEGQIIPNEKYERYSNRFKGKINNKRILTPKGNQIRKVCFNGEDNLIIENEELKKKCFNLINFYSLLTKKLKRTCKNNIKFIKKLRILKEKYNNLKKYKYRMAQILNLNDSKKIGNHAYSHYEEEKLLNKILNIKLKENSIYQNIVGEDIDEEKLQNKINILFTQKKEMLLNLIKNIVKYYGNISQIYNNNKDKKEQFNNLLNRYNINETIKPKDLNYISYINKRNNFEDRIITEVDEDKENEEEDEEKAEKDNLINTNNNVMEKENNYIFNTNNNLINKDNNINKNINTDNNNNVFNTNEINNNNNKIQEIHIYNIKNKTSNKKENNIDNGYDENLNNLIEKILIEQFPENYKTNLRFIYQEKNKYCFKNNIFYAYIEDNDVVLKEEIDGIINNNKLTLNEFYQKYCVDKNNNFVYTKKVRQKYIKLKTNDEQSVEKKIKNENSTTIETEQKISISNSKINEINDEKL